MLTLASIHYCICLVLRACLKHRVYQLFCSCWLGGGLFSSIKRCTSAESK